MRTWQFFGLLSAVYAAPHMGAWVAASLSAVALAASVFVYWKGR